MHVLATPVAVSPALATLLRPSLAELIAAARRACTTMPSLELDDALDALLNDLDENEAIPTAAIEAARAVIREIDPNAWSVSDHRDALVAARRPDEPCMVGFEYEWTASQCATHDAYEAACDRAEHEGTDQWRLDMVRMLDAIRSALAATEPNTLQESA